MLKDEILSGVVHDVQEDLKQAMINDPKVLDFWNSFIPLSRNEWICWVILVKEAETRKKHIDRLCEDLLNGKRRPCCWAGCPHRK